MGHDEGGMKECRKLLAKSHLLSNRYKIYYINSDGCRGVQKNKNGLHFAKSQDALLLGVTRKKT
jgi:hypothetical protein